MADRYDLLIVGMGSGGMVAAEFASTLGIRVGVIERDRVGGDCLWTGCVPSKALLASSKAAHTMRHADHYGIEPVEPTIDTAKVWDRIRAIQQRIADTDDNPERFRDMGVEVIMGGATITGPNTVSVDGDELESRFILLCTGSRPVTPPVEGLEEAGFLTSENVWDLERAPESLIAIGGGPISIELSQACQRLGIPTTVLQKGPGILPRDEPDLVEVLVERLRGEGLELVLGVDTKKVEVRDGHKIVHAEVGGEPRSWEAAELLVGAGRRPNVEGLGLEELGIEVGRRGVVVDDAYRTAVKSIYAVGDLAGRYLFTHSAGYEASRAIRNMFFPGSTSKDFLVPWCTFTDPELAHAGMTTGEAREEFGADDVKVFRQDLDHSDRARTDSADHGAILIVTAKGRVVGAHALAPAAGELVHELALAIDRKLKLTEVASMVHVYPTLSIGIQQLAAEAAFEKAEKYRWLVRGAKR
jgi:pyruvate/2-oxoglutarate dehydrogenase complex dihydrolipoamide dehydrogenase (E3) component